MLTSFYTSVLSRASTSESSVNSSTLTTSVSTTSESGTTLSTSTSPVPSAQATLKCDPSGYLIQGATLYRINITTGASAVVKSGIGDGTNINAMGYNIGDNFLYAAAIAKIPNTLYRISATGDITSIGTLNASYVVNTADVDEQSQYWASASGKDWIQVDLKPNSPTFGKMVTKGTATLSYIVIDWAFVPKRGNYLWALGADSVNRATAGGSNTYLLKFDRSTKSWTTVIKFGDIAGNGDATRNAWGAVYASDDGYLYGSENYSGEIWRFPTNATGPPTALPMKVSNGPAANGNDGARCIGAANI